MRSAVLAALLVISPAWAQTGDEGRAVDGLRLSVATARQSPDRVDVRVTLRHTGGAPKLVPFAFATGEDVAHYRVRLFVATADRQYGFKLEDDKPIRGRFDPLVIPSARNASYTLDVPVPERRPIVEYNRPVVPLGELVGKTGYLWVEWDCSYWQGTAQPPCPLYGYPNPNGLLLERETPVESTLATGFPFASRRTRFISAEMSRSHPGAVLPWS